PARGLVLGGIVTPADRQGEPGSHEALRPGAAGWAAHHAPPPVRSSPGERGFSRKYAGAGLFRQNPAV
ncbi:MAG: hypothetical protein WBP94_03705, partial [Rhodomicrobiaceae bacterium]